MFPSFSKRGPFLNHTSGETCFEQLYTSCAILLSVHWLGQSFSYAVHSNYHSQGHKWVPAANGRNSGHLFLSPTEKDTMDKDKLVEGEVGRIPKDGT